MNEYLLTREQKDAIISAGLLLKKVFLKDKLQICFNITSEFDNVNYNIKASGILYPAKKPKK